ncbi:MAG: hypothetical protein A2X46_10540 [Lentisphaerae bacterium GWF2_57_35]|nr:MAG: hypothetical protein A2X46_10540 [Lentisphaerae bacterium GWF2_57_35]
MGTAGVAVARVGFDSAEAGWFGFGGPRDEWLRIGKLQDFPENAKLVVHDAVRAPDGKKIKNLKLIAERRGEQVSVMSTRCTHFGCEVTQMEDGTFVCPCHDSHFDASGAVTKGPAKQPLPWHATQVTDGEVQVNLSKVLPAPQI